MRNQTRGSASRLAAALSTVAVAATLLLSAAPARSQGLGIGVEGGPTFADFSVSEGGADLESRTGFRVAGVLRYGFAGPLGLQSGVGLAQKGTSLSTTDADYKVSYIEIPLLITATIPAPAAVSPRVFVGSQVGIESSCKISGLSGVPDAVDCTAQEVGEAGLDTKSTNVDLVFGGGLDFQLSGPLTLTLDGRYDLGMSDINDLSGTDVTNEIKNRSFSASAGILLSLP